jgi:actin-related protein
MFCGDEVAAVVVDIGSETCKFGTAGEDSPRHVFRSDTGVSLTTPPRVLVDGALRSPTVRMDMRKLLVPNGALNWDSAEALMTYGASHMRVDIKDYPILYAESHFKSGQDKAKVRTIPPASYI